MELKKIFRQASESDIVVNAHKINRGEQVVPDNKSRDFFFLRRYDADIIIRVVIALIQEKMPRYVQAKPFDIQVLTPMRKGLLGVERLNQILQRYLNPPENGKKERELGGQLFRQGDKVMQVKNNYQLEWEVRGKYGIPVEKGVGVFNGDTGILTEINEFAETATVEFEDGRCAEYSFKQMEELELAYAITIHKSQGSEYPAVVIPLLSGPQMLLNRNLLYTAVTRARKCVTIVGSEETFGEMIRNEKQQRRYSSLDVRIQGVKSGRRERSRGERTRLRAENFLNLLYPRCCPLCHEILREQKRLLCPECEKKIRPVSGARCMKCGRQVDKEAEYCRDCGKRKRNLHREKEFFPMMICGSFRLRNISITVAENMGNFMQKRCFFWGRKIL